MKASTFARFGALVAVLAAFAGTWSSTATASPTWQWGGEGITHALPFTSPVETAYFEAVNAVGGREFTLACHMKTAGVVGPGAHGEISSVADSNGLAKMQCEQTQSGLEQCAPPETVEAQSLPWATELVFGTGTEVRNTIKPGSKGGTPGWKITCKQVSVETLVEKCPFGGYSVFSRNGALGAELLYEPAFAQGKNCESNSGYFQGNTLKLTYREVTPKYTINW